MRRKTTLLALSGLLLAGVAVAGVPRLVSGRGWAPLVVLAGRGDAALAIERLGQGLSVLRCVLHGLAVDAPTRAFVEELRGSLGDMDLEELHELLPLREGAWRRVRVMGRREGEAYAVRLAPAAVAAAIDPRGFGGRTGDLLAQLGTRASGGNYVTQLEAGLGVGPVGWEQLTGCLAEAARLAASGDPRAKERPERASCAAPATRLRVVEKNPGLRPEDVDVLAVLWESFPRLTDVLLEVGRVDDVLVFDPRGAGEFQQLRLAGRLRPDVMEERYPELAVFLADLGPLLDARVRWVDAKGRQVARMSLDTATLALTLEGFVRDGRLLPVGGDGQVVLDAGDPGGGAAGAPVELKGVIDLRFNMNGIVTDVRGLELDGQYARRADGADLTGRISRVPSVAVSGNAFGLLPAWALDIVIPGNVAELTTELLTAMCRGDGGRGASFALRARQAGPDGPGVVTVSGQVEVLNSLLIRLGFQIASQKLLPDDDVRAEVWALFTRAHAAFEQDLAGYARALER